MLQAKAPEIVEELLQDKSKTHLEFMKENKEIRNILDWKYYILFRNDWEAKTVKKVSTEFRKIKGVSNIQILFSV